MSQRKHKSCLILSVSRKFSVSSMTMDWHGIK
eukprot:UN21318